MNEYLSGGNMADVMRIGDIVRKPKGPWWHATSQVLGHLEAVGYPSAPRIVAEATDTVDLTFIPGHAIPASLEGYDDERLLAIIGREVRRYHDAMTGFRLSPGTETVPWPGDVPYGTLVCHNDLSPWNTIIEDGHFRGFIDWDLVSPSAREWELAWVIWRWAPLYPTGERTRLSIKAQVDRMGILLDAYGRDVIHLDNFTQLIATRMQTAVDVVEQLGRAEVPGFDRLLASGMHLSGHDDARWLKRHWSMVAATVGM